MESLMDTNKWKSVLGPKEVYEQIKNLSVKEGRTISGQLRVIFKDYQNLNAPLSKNNISADN